jgi:deoxyribonuclease V
MQIHNLHSWKLTPTEAVALQRELAGRVVTDTPLTVCETIAGADVSYNRFSSTFYAGVVVVRIEDGEVLERRGAVADVPFPYVPGLLSFRETPALLEAFAKIETRPDAVMCDGHGLAHPRRFGVACHLGLLLDVPTIGCAKSRLTGEFDDPASTAGSTAPLRLGSDIVGEMVRTKNRVKPLFVSPGHRIDIASSTRWVLASCRGYRLPEPTRQAHLFVNELRRGEVPQEAGARALPK